MKGIYEYVICILLVNSNNTCMKTSINKLEKLRKYLLHFFSNICEESVQIDNTGNKN